MDYEQTEHSTVRRLPERAAYDRDTVHAILDEGLVAHVGLVADGRPVVIPMIYGREGDVLYLHGSPASRLLRHGKAAGSVCVTVTLLDGLVLARSPFHHSVNYRSVVVMGEPTPVEDLDEKNRVLDLITNHVVPGRTDHARANTDKEIRGTLVLRMDIDEVSAKVRTGPPVDDEEDYALDVWAGVLPLALRAGRPEADPRLTDGIAVPDHVSRWGRSPQP